jgi:hypothetical protein
VRKTPFWQCFRERNNWMNWSQIHGVVSRKQRQLPSQLSATMVYAFDFSACFTWGPTSKFVETNLDSFEANWILELDPALDPSLHLGSSNHGLTFLVLSFWLEPIDFPSKMLPWRFSLTLPLFGLQPWFKGPRCPIYDSHRIFWWSLPKKIMIFLLFPT